MPSAKDDRPGLFRRRLGPAVDMPPPKSSMVLPVIGLVALAVIVAAGLLIFFGPVTVRG